MLLYARRYMYKSNILHWTGEWFLSWVKRGRRVSFHHLHPIAICQCTTAFDCITTRQCFNKKVPWRNTSLWRWRKKIKEPEGLEKKKIPNRAKGWRRPPATCQLNQPYQRRAPKTIGGVLCVQLFSSFFSYFLVWKSSGRLSDRTHNSV